MRLGRAAATPESTLPLGGAEMLSPCAWHTFDEGRVVPLDCFASCIAGFLARTAPHRPDPDARTMPARFSANVRRILAHLIAQASMPANLLTDVARVPEFARTGRRGRRA
jgi:hypothetical protein